MLKVGLTGGIGSGKSTVSAEFENLGVPVFDADIIAHQITSNYHPVLEDVAKLLGEQSVVDGAMDRSFVRKLVFSQPKLKRQLENLLHPAIRSIMDQQVADCDADYCILSIPLLLETGQQHRVDRILVVDADETRRVEWIKSRSGLSETEIEKIFAAQVDRDTRLDAANDVISNHGTLDDIKHQVASLHRKYLDLTTR